MNPIVLDRHLLWNGLFLWVFFFRNHLYFVKTDIKACFDGILQEKLLEIIEDFLSQV